MSLSFMMRRSSPSIFTSLPDRVLFGKWSGSEVKIDGEDLLIMKESDILGVLSAPVKTKAAA